MPLTIKKENQCCTLSFQEEFTIYDVAELKQQITTEVLDQGRVEIDLSDLSELDTSGLQLLIALQQSCRRNKQGFSISKVSPRIVALMELFSFTFESEDEFLP
ncbi:MAG: hypothetical protein COB67_07675 [SAR324 cluster bacterium]|uniref:STAS domain-containing protein n=1 Tax=SAR324 cluster bacterium TaxID=2024889 RepID=A0A2A4T2X7_9DELT|nr:MAG: hypothetical protein COB67_07675 [SAR324 cluster bacterium]